MCLRKVQLDCSRRVKVLIHRSPEGIKLFIYEYYGDKLLPSDEDWIMFGEMEVDKVEEKTESWEPTGRSW